MVWREGVGGRTYSEAVPNLSRIQKLVEDTIDGFDKSGQTTSAILRTCIRIATLRNDFTALLWLQLEADDGDSASPARDKQRRLALLAHMDKEEAIQLDIELTRAYMRRRMIPGQKDKIYAGSVDGLEEYEGSLRWQADALVVPGGLHPIDAYHRSADITKAKLTLASSTNDFRTILTRIRAALHEFLVATERQLDYGKVNADIFERARVFVDEQLATVAPDALDQFQSAYRRVSEGDVESLSHALTSCRRILKSVADAVYPPTATPVVGADGKAHKLHDAAYKNRLLQFVHETIQNHGAAGVIKSTIEDLAGRLDALDGLASKGVHATVSTSEVDTCVIQTYLVVGDVLRVKLGRSALPEVLHDSVSH